MLPVFYYLSGQTFHVQRMKNRILFFFAMMLILSASAQEQPYYDVVMKRTQWWREARLGMLVEVGLYSIPARGCEVWSMEKTYDSVYTNFINEFNPSGFDAKAIARTARESGMKYVMMSVKHYDGFCLYDSKLTDFKVTKSPCKRDLFREFVDACRAEGLKIGIMYSLIDWHHPDYPVYEDLTHPRRGDYAYENQKRDLARYIEYMHGQIKELLTSYGKIDIIGVEYSYYKMSGETWKAYDLVNAIHKLQPDIIINSGFGGKYSLFNTDQEYKPYGDYDVVRSIMPAKTLLDYKQRPTPWELFVTMNNLRGYSRNDHNYKPASLLINTLVECTGKNGNLLLCVDLTPKGTIPEASEQSLHALGEWMKKNGSSIYGCGPAVDTLAKPDWGRYTQKGKYLYAHVLQPPLNYVMIPNYKDKYKKIRLLHDGSEIQLDRNVGEVNGKNNLYLNIQKPAVNYYPLPDPVNTVYEIELK